MILIPIVTSAFPIVMRVHIICPIPVSLNVIYVGQGHQDLVILFILTLYFTL